MAYRPKQNRPRIPAPVPPGGFSVNDLDGCLVVTESGETLGELKDVYPTGANDVFVVVAASGREYLLPALKDVVLNVDTAARRILVRLPPGLREVYEA